MSVSAGYKAEPSRIIPGQVRPCGYAAALLRAGVLFLRSLDNQCWWKQKFSKIDGRFGELGLRRSTRNKVTQSRGRVDPSCFLSWGRLTFLGLQLLAHCRSAADGGRLLHGRAYWKMMAGIVERSVMNDGDEFEGGR